MACPSSERKQSHLTSHLSTTGDKAVLFGAGDVQVIDDETVRPLLPGDWPADMHKLSMFIPEAFTPVCESELGAMAKWTEAFEALGCRLIAACVDSPARLFDWFETEPQLAERPYLTFSSYQLPLALNILENGRSKRASVFVAKDGEIVKQEYPAKVGRSLKELHRMVWAYNQDDYCGEGLTGPVGDTEDGKISHSA